MRVPDWMRTGDAAVVYESSIHGFALLVNGERIGELPPEWTERVFKAVQSWAGPLDLDAVEADMLTRYGYAA